MGSCKVRLNLAKEQTQRKRVLFTWRPRCRRTRHPLDRWFCVSAFRRICPFQFRKYDQKIIINASSSPADFFNYHNPELTKLMTYRHNSHATVNRTLMSKDPPLFVMANCLPASNISKYCATFLNTYPAQLLIRRN